MVSLLNLEGLGVRNEAGPPEDRDGGSGLLTPPKQQNINSLNSPGGTYTLRAAARVQEVGLGCLSRVAWLLSIYMIF